MDNGFILSHVDHTLLKADASWLEIVRLCDEAVAYKTASVCVPPSYVRRIRDNYPNLCICTVVGFPLGYDTMATKCAAAHQAIINGADEIDMVINLGCVKNGDINDAQAEISAVKRACGDRIVKVIIETCYLTENEKISLCKAVTSAGADYIKTSTGFGPAGAAIDDIKLFKANIGKGVKIKAAGGIRARKDMVMFIEAGCSRIGSSAAVGLLGIENAKG